MSRGKRGPHSETTRKKQSASASANGAAYAESLLKAAEVMMATIEEEMRSNEGIYPHNGGSLSRAELSRRLALDESTIRKNHKPLYEAIKVWIAGLSNGSPTNKTQARRSETERAAAWKQQYQDLLASYHVHELDWQEMTAELSDTRVKLNVVKAEMADIKVRFTELNEENARLRAALAQASLRKVVSLDKHRPIPLAVPPSMD